MKEQAMNKSNDCGELWAWPLSALAGPLVLEEGK